MVRGIFFIILLFALSSCNQRGAKGIQCSNGKGVKSKSYRLKKMKPYQKQVGGGTASTVGAKEELDAQKEAQQKAAEERALKEETNQPEEEIASIAETKLGVPPKKEKKIEFQGQEIDLAEGEYVFEEEISFVNSTDLFSDPELARDQLKELSKLLKKNKDIKLTIVGNTASSVPEEGTLYGDSEEVLNQETTLNTRTATIKDSMLARGKRVYKLLVDNGVPKEQIEYKTGSHRQYKHQRVVAFILK